ncbi:GxxExxY protein [Rubritalea sp.]|uniref:GxxExxY protein n=1 Tax=Rubritalea sp. TaxID=2109375 RepID=UPI003EF9F81B
MSIIYKEESYAIMGAVFEVYKEMGSGLKELVYHECLVCEFLSRKISAVHEPKLELEYKGQKLLSYAEPDFLCYGKIVVELKSVNGLNDAHRAQVHNYLRASGYKLGLLINFGHYPQVEYERIIIDPRTLDA